MWLFGISEQPLHMVLLRIKELYKFSEIYGKGVLLDAGKISHNNAIKKAMEEYKKYQVKTLSPVEKAYLESIKKIAKTIEKK